MGKIVLLKKKVSNTLNMSPFLLSKSLKLLQIYWCPGMDSGLQCAPLIFYWIQVWALCSLVKDVHFAHLEVVLHQKRGMLWVVIMLEDKTSTQTIFCCRLPEVVFQNLLVVFRFHDSFDPDKIPRSKCTETSPQHYTPTSMFHSGDGVLWVEHLSRLSPNIGSISMAKELYFCLI